MIFIGFESGADNQLKRYNKGISVEENTRALQILRDLSLDASIGFITFDPLMSKEDLQQNLTFIEQSGLLSSNFYPFSKLMAFRDAPITKGLENEGLLKEFDLNTISYSYKYKDPEIARIVTILEDWERDFYEFRWALTYLQRIKRMDPRTSAQADKLKDFGNELRAIEFLLLKEVAFTKNLNDDGLIREILVKFDQQRTNFLQRIRNSIVIQQEIEDKNGKLLKEIEDLYSKLNPGYASRKDIGSLRRLREYLNGTFRSSDQFAEIWDDIFIGESNDLFWAFTHETYSEQPKILDIGTGTGKGLLPIATNLKTGTLVGVDLSANMLNVARRKFQSQFPHLQTIFKQIDAHELELHLASISPFDAIIARYSLQFMNIDKVLPQAFNLLKPGGILLFNAFASNFYGVSGQFRSTNPFYTVLYFTYKRILEDYLPYLENTIIDELIGQSQISKSSNSKYELIGPAIIQDSRFDPNTLKETLLHYNFSDIQFMPAPEQYPVAEKLRHALLVSSMPFYWGVFGKFSPQLKEEIIIKTYDELPPAYGKDKTVIVTDVFVKGRKPA
ncbi:MAG: methyltransferase domain-containing protein [Candidatus Saganbacteria bacterium]|nr:methyltransferase domain-containing protein [Candidatus Saganbacteria bacterium]